MKLYELSKLIEGEISGDPDIEINGVNSIEAAGRSDITFLLSKKNIESLKNTRASAVVTSSNISGEFSNVIVKDPYLAMITLLDLFSPYKKESDCKGIDKSAVIGDGVTLGKGVTIFPNVTVCDGCVIGESVTLYSGTFIGKGVRIGNNSVIHPNTTIYHSVSIGENVIIHSGTVIGSDGFGYHMVPGRGRVKIPQIGSVIIEDDVEIGANVCVDRGTIGNTVIKGGTKIDNLVQIAHNVTIEEDVVIAGQSGISGSSVIGRGVMMGGSVGVADHVKIEAGTMLAANTGVTGNLKRGIYSGSPAIEHGLWKRIQASLPRLPELIKKVRALEKK